MKVARAISPANEANFDDFDSSSSRSPTSSPPAKRRELHPNIYPQLLQTEDDSDDED